MSLWRSSESSTKAKRPHPQESDEDDFDSYSSNTDSDGDWEAKPTAKKSPKKRTRKDTPSKAAKKTVQVATKASILSLSTNEIPGSQSASERLADVDSAILGKIKKALALGGHQGTGEAEAKRAMRLATKLMAQHNVNQADILAAEADSEKLKRAGQSTVTIRSTSGKNVVLHSWSQNVVSAIEIFFDCKAYSERFGDRIDWIFYGLSEQTVAAAYAFEMVYNLILVWSVQNKIAKGRTGKNNYCHGVGEGLYKMAKEDRRAEEARVIRKERERLENARKEEAEERRKAVERLEGPVHHNQDDQPVDADAKVKIEEMPECVKVKIEEVPEECVKVKIEEVLEGDVKLKFEDATHMEKDHKVECDSDSDAGFGIPADGPVDIEVKADFDGRDYDIDQMLQDMEHDFKPVSEPVKRGSVLPSQRSAGPISVAKCEEDDTPWASSQQLTLFRNNASSIADDFLKQNKIKLSKGRAARGPKLESDHDLELYRQGQRDARNIDIKQKRIKEGLDDK